MTRQHADGTTEFRFFRPRAGHVTLAGEFNGWDPRSLPMTAHDDGWWSYRLRLAPGAYQLKYHADGQWFTDYAAFGLERGPFDWNSVVHVPPHAAGAASAA